MYLENEVNAPTVQTVNIAPNPSHASGATWTTQPALPSCLSIGAATGVISGSTECLPSFSQYVILRTAGTETNRFYITFTTSRERDECDILIIIHIIIIMNEGWNKDDIVEERLINHE